MAKINIALVVVFFLLGVPWAKASMVTLSNIELAQSCYRGSPELLSDKCFGREYSIQNPPNFALDGYPVNSGSQMGNIYQLLSALQGAGSPSILPGSDQPYAMGALLDWRGTGSNLGLMQNSNPDFFNSAFSRGGAIK